MVDPDIGRAHAGDAPRTSADAGSGLVADPATAAAPRWWIFNGDPFGRCRKVNIVVQHGMVIVVAPRHRPYHRPIRSGR